METDIFTERTYKLALAVISNRLKKVLDTKALGVVFSPLVFNIWDLNSQEVLLKV